MSSITPLRKPVRRRVGRLVVRLDAEGVSIRGHGRRTWQRLTWERLAAAADEDSPVIAEMERVAGVRVLHALGAQTESQS